MEWYILTMISSQKQWKQEVNGMTSLKSSENNIQEWRQIKTLSDRWKLRGIFKIRLSVQKKCKINSLGGEMMIVRTLKSSEENEIPKMINVWLSIKRSSSFS